MGNSGVAGGGVGAGSILASGNYAPASSTLYATSSQAFSDIDATNIKLTFTAPTSGSVMACLSIPAQTGASTVNGAVTCRVSPAAGAATATAINDTVQVTPQLAPIVLTGLTAGVSYTAIWRFASGVGGTSFSLNVGGNTTQAGNGGAAVFWVVQL